MKNNELYHYGVLGMRWGRRKAANEISTISKHDKKKTETTTPKKKGVSKKTKVVIGSSVTAAALAGIGVMLTRDATAEKIRTLTIGKAMVDNMW